MTARRESWSLRADPRRAAAAAALALAFSLVAWLLLHQGFYTRDQIIDTPVYERYGDAIERGEVPYRDFAVEYPPGALPVFAAPALGADGGDRGEFGRRFEALMWACGALMVAGVVLTLAAVRADTRRLLTASAFVALAPLALGSLVLSRFDLWPAALTALALAALVAGRVRAGFGVLALAVVAKVYAAVLAPVWLAYVWRRRGAREAAAAAAVFAAVVLAVLAPFVVLAPGGVWEMVSRQLTRGLQIESLGSALLLAAHQLFDVGLTMRSSAGSQNLAGTGADALALAQTFLQGVVLLGIWLWSARDAGDPERLLRASAAAVCAFVALGKVLSPQFLIWLVPLVPLVRGRRGLLASALLAVALVLTQLWFPYRYFDLALDFEPLPSWLVLARDLVLLAMLAVLLFPRRTVTS